MKKILFMALGIWLVTDLTGQIKEGKVIYQRNAQLKMMMGGPGMQGEPTTQTRIDKFEMNFAAGQMIWKKLEDDMPEENTTVSDGGNFIIRTMAGGVDDITFCDFAKAKKVETKEFMEKKFLVCDSLRAGNWKMGEETKTILGYICHRASSQKVNKRMQMSMENGKMERKETDDTTQVVAWFTTDIPVPAGPEVQGQLPGLILQLETNEGKNVYTAIEISAKPNLSSIKEPTKGKRVTPAESAIERNKIMDEMEKNNGGRGDIQIRMN